MSAAPKPAGQAGDLGRFRDAMGGWLEEVFPELRLLGCVGRGGGGAVYRAEHRQLKRPLAIKVLAGGMARSAASVARFEREIEAVGKLDHPGIVRAFDGGQRQGVWFLTMEWVEGVDLGAVSRAVGCLEAADACRLVEEAAVALCHAHERGLVHRDVKPGNLMLAAPVVGGQPRVKVLDFGLAQVLRGDGDGGDLTLSSDFLGTVDYVAPEQIVNPREADARADIHALGATLVRLLVGRPPRTLGGPADSLYQRLMRAADAPPFRLEEHRADLPAGLCALVNQMLERDPQRRPGSAREVAERLAEHSGGADLAGLFARVRVAAPKPEATRGDESTPRSHRGSPWRLKVAWAGGVALTGLAIAGGWWRPANPPTPQVPEAPVLVASRSLGKGWMVVIPPSMEAGVPEPIRGEGPEILMADWAAIPTMVSDGWVVTRTFRLGSPRSGQFAPGLDGLIFCEGAGQDSSVGVIDSQGRYFRRVGGVGAETLAMAPDGNFVAWSDPARSVLGFGKLDLGTLERRARYRGAPEGAQPMGLAYAPVGWGGRGVGEGEGLVVDGGGRATRGVWKFSVASEEVTRVVGDLEWLDQPVDIAFTRDSAYLVNRVRGRTETGSEHPGDLDRRLFRLEGDRLVPCTTDRPMADPCGVAWDPGSGDLYVLCGQQLKKEPDRRRLLRLRRMEGADRFSVTEVMVGFREPTLAGVDVSPDGQLLMVTEFGGARLDRGFVYVMQKR